MVANEPKWYEMHQNMSLVSHGVDRVLSLRKIPTRLCGMKFCTSSECFASSFARQPNGRKCNKTHQNMSLGSNGVDWVRSSRKKSDSTSCTIFCTSSGHFALSFVRQLNGPKCNEMVQNATKHKFRDQSGGSGVFVVQNSDATLWDKLFH